jgi:hypothetical protein
MAVPDATADLLAIRRRLSPARLERYERASGGGIQGALALYQWNTEVSAALYALLQAVEVILRNALVEELIALHDALGYSGEWFDDPFRLLDARHHDNISAARQKICSERRDVTSDRLVSELTFGFWRYLLSAKYEHTLWVPALRKAFPGVPNVRRKYIAGRVERLHYLRNRIAHHEPVFPRRLDRDCEEAFELITAVCPASAGWVQTHSWARTMVGLTLPGQVIRGRG